MAEHTKNSSGSSIQDRWQSFLGVRSELALELDRMATDMPGESGKQLRLLGQWFRGPAELEDALERPDVLAICLPWIKTPSPADGARPDIRQAAREGFCAMGRNVSISKCLIRMMLYPVLVLFACVVVGILFSFFVAPQFEEMFTDFGIELPRATSSVFGLSQLVRQFWWVILTTILGSAVLFWVLSRTGSGSRPFNISWLDKRLMSTRNTLASWAWHISLLLDVGISQREAIKSAGIASGNSRLRLVGIARAERSDETDSRNDLPYFDSPKYRLLDNAMRLETSAGKIVLLREVATYYWDRSRSIGDWWIQWLVSAILCVVGIMIALVILALFAPMIAIISGLTGVR